jgi:hypothetical protein
VTDMAQSMTPGYDKTRQPNGPWFVQ